MSIESVKEKPWRPGKAVLKVPQPTNLKGNPRVENPGEPKEEAREEQREKARRVRTTLPKETGMELEHVWTQNVLLQQDFTQILFLQTV